MDTEGVVTGRERREKSSEDTEQLQSRRKDENDGEGM